MSSRILYKLEKTSPEREMALQAISTTVQGCVQVCLVLAAELCFRWSTRRRSNRVQPTLRFLEPRPSPRPLALARPYCPRAMRATDAGVVPVVQRVIGNIAFTNVSPYILRTPIHDGIDLYQAKFCVPLDLARAGTKRRLIAANAGDPRP